jgi:hypothetical protein
MALVRVRTTSLVTLIDIADRVPRAGLPALS